MQEVLTVDVPFARPALPEARAVQAAVCGCVKSSRPSLRVPVVFADPASQGQGRAGRGRCSFQDQAEGTVALAFPAVVAFSESQPGWARKGMSSESCQRSRKLDVVVLTAPEHSRRNGHAMYHEELQNGPREHVLHQHCVQQKILHPASGPVGPTERRISKRSLQQFLLLLVLLPRQHSTQVHVPSSNRSQTTPTTARLTHLVMFVLLVRGPEFQTKPTLTGPVQHVQKHKATNAFRNRLTTFFRCPTSRPNLRPCATL